MLRLPLPVWAVLALASVVIGSTLALVPDRSSDLAIVRDWFAHWASTGQSVYLTPDLHVDYPPYALVLLYPLHWLPEAHAATWYLPFNLITTAAMAWAMAGWLADETGAGRTSRNRFTFALMLLTWGSIRVALWKGQTVALAIWAGIAAVRLAARHPLPAGLLLTVAACKPSLGLGFGLILLLRGHGRAVTAGVVGAFALTTAFAVSVGQMPWTVLADYLDTLKAMYASRDYFRGVTTLRPLLHDLFDGHPAVVWVYGALGLAALGALIVIARPVRRHPHAQGMLIVACLLWTLLALPNQRYYLTLLAPAVWLLWFTPHRVADTHARWPTWLVAFTIAFNMVDGPLVVRMFGLWLGEVVPEAYLDYVFLVWASSYIVAAPLVIVLYVQMLRGLRRLQT